jgi:short-subunit dehydrogenase
MGLAQEFWLLGRDAQELEKTGKGLQSPYRTFAFPLEERKAREEFLQAVHAENPDLRLLINNAGFGLHQDFTATSWPSVQELLSVNIEALVHLTHSLNSLMNPGSHLILVSSIAAYTPLRRMNLYSSSKAFVLSFGLALGLELRPRGVGVQVLCPGPLNSGFAHRAGGGRSYRSFQKRLSPGPVARKSLEALEKRKKVVYGTLFWRLLSSLLSLIPKHFLAWVLLVFSSQDSSIQTGPEDYPKRPG